MTIQEKTAYLMEVIPSEEEVLELKKRYLFGGLEARLLLDASETLRSPNPDPNLVEWAYELLQLHIQKSRTKESERISSQEKMERILALFSNTEDLQEALSCEEWSPSDRRAIQLVSHFVTNDIPLVSNFKIVNKVYRLLNNARLPSHIATKYFGKNIHTEERNRILERYENYRARKEHRPSELPTAIEDTGLMKRYAYMIGALAAVVGIFLSGFITAKLIYGQKADAMLTETARESLLRKKESGPKKAEDGNETIEADRALDQHVALNRVLLQERLREYGLDKNIEFATKATAESARPGLEHRFARSEGVVTEALVPSERESPRLTGPMKVAVEAIAGLHGLELPLAVNEDNLSIGTPVPEGFRLKSEETPSLRLVYLTDGKTFYPVELYSFTAEPFIVEYRLVMFKPGHYMPVVSNIWHFTDIGELRMHKHFVYQKDRIAPAKIITNLFLPGGESLEMVSVPKLDRDRRAKELPLSRKDYLPNAKMLYEELHEIDRLEGHWRSRLVRQVWYDEGKKILAKGLGPKE
jgi:hypothetical protein